MRQRIHFALIAAALIVGAGCQKAEKPTPEVVIVPRDAIPADPTDKAWKKAPPHIAQLVLQDMVDPRLMKASTPQVEVRAISDGKDIAFRLTWPDETKNDLPGPGVFPDACAVQLPRATDADLPAPQMGEPLRLVDIAFWRASWQAVVDGRGDTIKDIHPGATVDHYPFEAESLKKDKNAQLEMQSRYAPARALGNTMAGPRDRPVEMLVAEGPGTLTPNPAKKANGKGVWKDGAWTVVISQPLPDSLRSAQRYQIAFAVWQGQSKEAGSRKMRTGWVSMVKQQGKS